MTRKEVARTNQSRRLTRTRILFWNRNLTHITIRIQIFRSKRQVMTTTTMTTTTATMQRLVPTAKHFRHHRRRHRSDGGLRVRRCRGAEEDALGRADHFKQFALGSLQKVSQKEKNGRRRKKMSTKRLRRRRRNGDGVLVQPWRGVMARDLPQGLRHFKRRERAHSRKN